MICECDGGAFCGASAGFLTQTQSDARYEQSANLASDIASAGYKTDTQNQSVYLTQSNASSTYETQASANARIVNEDNFFTAVKNAIYIDNGSGSEFDYAGNHLLNSS